MSDRAESFRGGDLVLLGLRVALMGCALGLVAVLGNVAWKIFAG